MRTHIVHRGAGELTYEIRNIVRVAEKLQRLGMTIIAENIGDPVTKGEAVPGWIKEIVAELAMDDCTYGYCPTQGVLETREFLAERTNRLGGVQITPEDIVFFNGLGEAISKVYGFLRSTARVMTPSPTYTTHSSAEASHAGLSPVSYPLNPRNRWYPDLDELYRRVKYNPSVAGILIVNPDNPTGAVYPESIIREIVGIAKEFDLFLIADEIYQNLIYNGQETLSLAEVVEEVPGISMKGISKEFPWPGARCGWIEVYNREKDTRFASYVQSIMNAKMMEVCSTTLPQKAIPRILRHPAYPDYLEARKRRYEAFSNIALEKFADIPGVLANRPNGAFYMSVAFEEGMLNGDQTLPIPDASARTFVEGLTSAEGIQPDKRLVYYLLGSTGVCVVPLSSFNSKLQGFRLTLLEPDEGRFTRMVETLANGVKDYLLAPRLENEHAGPGLVSRAGR